MRLQTILNRVEKIKSFTYGDAHFEEQAGGPALVVQVLPRKNSLPYCSGCYRRGRPFDHLKERRFEFVPLWGILVFLRPCPVVAGGDRPLTIRSPSSARAEWSGLSGDARAV
jgi:hypothetical protein